MALHREFPSIRNLFLATSLVVLLGGCVLDKATKQARIRENLPDERKMAAHPSIEGFFKRHPVIRQLAYWPYLPTYDEAAYCQRIGGITKELYKKCPTFCDFWFKR